MILNNALTLVNEVQMYFSFDYVLSDVNNRALSESSSLHAMLNCFIVFFILILS